jgi:hypothetical protein
LGSQMIEAQRGEVITSELTLMERWRWSKSKVRGFIKRLQNEQMLIRKSDRKKTSLLIVNWDTYQGSETTEEPQKDHRKTADDTQSRMNKKEKKEEKEPGVISEEISSLVSKIFPFPGGNDLYSQMIKAISQTRKTGKLSQGVILSLLQELQKFPQENFQAGIRIYLEKEYYRDGKDENYLLGIIRKHRTGETKTPQEVKGTGSALLDAYYQKQAEGGQV